jgi:hypothetical protein
MAALLLRKHLSPLIHILVWILLGLMLLVFPPLNLNASLPSQFWVKQAVLFCLWVGAYYLNIWVWVPKFLFENKIGLYIIVIFITAISVTALIWLLEYW